MRKSAYCNDRIIARDVSVAENFFGRLRGLLGKEALLPGEGLLLTKVSSIHCFFMKFAIDAVYLSEDMVVTGVETVQPWHVGKRFPHTKHTLEVEAGVAIEHLQKGDRLEFKDMI